jgi:hypothetical protein
MDFVVMIRAETMSSRADWGNQNPPTTKIFLRYPDFWEIFLLRTAFTKLVSCSATGKAVFEFIRSRPRSEAPEVHILPIGARRQ